MKKLNYLWMLGLLMFAAVNFSACSDDDESLSSDLIGTWECVSSYHYVKRNGEIVSEGEEVDEHRIQLDGDGKCCYYGKDFYGDEWMLEYVGNWNYKNGNLILTEVEEDGDTDTEYYPVKSLTSTELVVEYYEKEDEYESYDKLVYHKVSE